ncbi:hypothetical protein G9A89_010550 [Geosiphon pyriformis]|nr:hypothetical protein G9A89_010550 [Geosiphon pyriformis]
MSEDIKRELEYVKTQYGRCVEELKEFRKGEKGDRLEELKRNLRVKKWTDTDEKEAWIEEKEDLEKQEKKLEASKDRWELQMEKLQDHFIETNKTAPEYKSGEDFCSAAGDIWMVGNLFKHAIIYDHISLSSSAQQFREKLMNKNSNSRPTANNALKDEWFNLPEEQLSIMQA